MTFATLPGGGTGVAPQFAISPDGSSVVLVAATEKGFQLWHRPLSAVDARLLPGSDGAAFPFWSPDSQSVGFFADGKLKRIRIAGGPPSVRLRRRAGAGRHLELEQCHRVFADNDRSAAARHG
jgi:Tol biopolymer transport system component